MKTIVFSVTLLFLTLPSFAQEFAVKNIRASSTQETISSSGAGNFSGYNQTFSGDFIIHHHHGVELGINRIKRYSRTENQYFLNGRLGLVDQKLVLIPHFAIAPDALFFPRTEGGLSAYRPLTKGITGYADATYRRYSNAHWGAFTIGADFEPSFGGLFLVRATGGVQDFDSTTTTHPIGGGYFKLITPQWNRFSLMGSWGWSVEGILRGVPPASDTTDVMTWSGGASFQIWNHNKISGTYEVIRYPVLNLELKRFYVGLEIGW